MKSNDAQSWTTAGSQPLGPQSLVATPTSEEEHTQGDEHLCYMHVYWHESESR